MISLKIYFASVTSSPLPSHVIHIFVQVRFWLKLRWPRGTKPCLLSKRWPCRFCCQCWQEMVQGESGISKFTLQQQNCGIAPLPQAGKRRDEEERSHAPCSVLALCPSPWQKLTVLKTHRSPHSLSSLISETIRGKNNYSVFYNIQYLQG